MNKYKQRPGISIEIPVKVSKFNVEYVLFKLKTDVK